MNDKLESWAKDFLEDVLAEANSVEDGEFRANVFFRRAAEILVDAGVCVDPSPCPYSARGLKVSGYDYLEDAESIDLFVVDFDATAPMRTVRRADVVQDLIRLGNFLSKALNGRGDQLEESSEAFDLAQTVRMMTSTLRGARLFFVTNGLVKWFSGEGLEVEGIPCSFEVWDIERLYQVISHQLEPENIKVDFKEEFGAGIPCTRIPGNEVYDVYLAIVPGTVLSSIYGEYGQRLLERNVRAFLQTRGKVNRGILDTLRNEPHMFLAYNNGISTTADSVVTECLETGELRLVKLTNLQIVNGGQTTASIHNAKTKHGADLSQVYVQMKLTVLKNADDEAEVIPRISLYANSQTKVNLSDFAANEKFHVALEQLSRGTWVPNPAGKATTKWFYERARGSYLDELGRNGTPAQRRAFQAQYPAGQKFTKTLMAKYEMTWMQQPHIVSLGAEKNFFHLTSKMAERRGFIPDDRYFKQLVAKIILFRRCDQIARKMDVAGYKANVVAYAIAWLSYLTSQRLDLGWIWDHQCISDATAEAIEALIPRVVEHVTSPSKAGMNITEWCKKEDCWTSLRAQAAPASAMGRLEPELIPVPVGSLQGGSQDAKSAISNAGGAGTADPGEIALIEQVSSIGETWFALSNWGKTTGYFRGFENGFLYQMGTLAARGRKPSPKQAKWAMNLYESAVGQGFNP